jgi:hypothetical protein
MRFWKEVAIVGVASLVLAGPTFAYNDYSGPCESSMEAGCTAEPPGYYDGYDDSQSHPLRIAAYAVNPVGYALEWLVTRPIHALVSQPELERIFGHQSHRWDYCCGMPQAAEAPPPVPAPVVHTEDVEAARRAAEEAKAAAEEAKRAAEEAARAAEKSTRGFEKSLTK